MPNLAINGGKPVRTLPWPRHNTIGEEEKQAVMEVLDSGVLSDFMGVWSDKFYGGPKVQELEHEWARYFGVEYAVSMNSATSGLYAACGAIGIKPGDEVIVSPYTMIASVTCAVKYGAIPVFADIDENTFCITADTIRPLITDKTKAIIVVDLFGMPANMDPIMALGIPVIEDAAQAPGAKYKGRYAGTLADIGVYSLNYHKQIHTGEGGVVVTNNAEYAERLQLIRNHGEVVVGNMGSKHVDIIGENYRLGEMEAAIALCQLRKLDGLIQRRVEVAEKLNVDLWNIKGLIQPHWPPGREPVCYLYAMRYLEDVTKKPRDKFVEAVQAEGVPIWGRYVKPIYWEPLYQKYGYPYRADCPVCERMYEHEMVYTNIAHAGTIDADIVDFTTAVHKVYRNLGELKG